MTKKITALKKILYVSFVLALCFIFIAPLSACKKTASVVKEGITIEPNTAEEYSKTLTDYAYSTVYGFMEQYYKVTVAEKVPDKTKSDFSAYATEIQQVTAKQNLTKNQYYTLFETLNNNLQNCVSALSKISKGTQSSQDLLSLKGVFTKLTAIVGADVMGAVLYDLSLFYYGFNENKYRADYDKYGFQYLLDDANLMAENKRILSQVVGKNNYVPATKLLYFLGGLFLGGAKNDALSSFSASEIALLTSSPDFSNIQTTAEGWNFLLERAGQFIPSTSFESKLFNLANENGDLFKLAEKMQVLLSLISSIQSNVDDYQCEKLKNGDRFSFISIAMQKFSDKDWLSFENVMALQLKNEEYSQIATQQFGQEYLEFLDNTAIYSLQQLKSAVGSEQFSSVLKGYLAGIFPALYYGVTK